MSHKYVPSGVFLMCDKGAGSGVLTATNHSGVLVNEEPIATEADLVPTVNVSPCGVCSVLQGPCVPAPVQWQDVKIDTVVGPPEWHPLLDCSTLPCTVGGNIRILFTRAEVEAAGEAQALHEAANAAKEVSLWALAGGALCAVAGVACCLTGVGVAAAPFLFAASAELFEASAVTFEAGIALDVAALAVEPNLPNLGIVVIDALTLGAGKVIGKVVGRVASKYGPALMEAAARRLAPKASFADFIESVEQFRGGARPELARQAHDLYVAENWPALEELFQRNAINGGWPPNRGAIGISETVLKPNAEFDRYGGYIDKETGQFVDKGTFVSPDQVPFPKRALPAETLSKPYNKYVVLKELPVKQGNTIPWFGQPGNGAQYELPDNITNLIRKGYIKPVE